MSILQHQSLIEEQQVFDLAGTWQSQYLRPHHRAYDTFSACSCGSEDSYKFSDLDSNTSPAPPRAHYECTQESPPQTQTRARHFSDPPRALSPSPVNLHSASEFTARSGLISRDRLNQRPKPQCWEHGCNGRQFSSFSELLRHQREKSGTASKSYCPRSDVDSTRTTAQDGHLANDKLTVGEPLDLLTVTEESYESSRPKDVPEIASATQTILSATKDHAVGDQPQPYLAGSNTNRRNELGRNLGTLEAIIGGAHVEYSKSVFCPLCDKHLKDRPGLRHHLDIHDANKTSRYKCRREDCDYASRYPKDVRRHMRVHGGSADDKWICCEFGCDRGFARKDNLQRHLRSAHPDRYNNLLRHPRSAQMEPNTLAAALHGIEHHSLHTTIPGHESRPVTSSPETNDATTDDAIAFHIDDSKFSASNSQNMYGAQESIQPESDSKKDSENSAISSGQPTESPTVDVANHLDLQVQAIEQLVQDAYDEYAGYLNGAAGTDEEDSTVYDHGHVSENDQQRNSRSLDSSGSIGTGESNTSGSHSNRLPNQTPLTLKQGPMRIRKDDEDSDDEDEEIQGRRLLQTDQYEHLPSRYIICPDEGCSGRDGGAISKWTEQLQHHNWHICCVCLSQPFKSKEDLKFHKDSGTCIDYCVSCKGGARHVRKTGCPERGHHVRRGRYEYICGLLGKDAKPFVDGRKIAHNDVKTRKRKRYSKEEAELRLLVALECKVSTLESKLVAMERDRKACYSVIRRLVDEASLRSGIKTTTLDDLKDLKPEVFTEPRLAEIEEQRTSLSAENEKSSDTSLFSSNADFSGISHQANHKSTSTPSTVSNIGHSLHGNSSSNSVNKDAHRYLPRNSAFYASATKAGHSNPGFPAVNEELTDQFSLNHMPRNDSLGFFTNDFDTNNNHRNDFDINNFDMNNFGNCPYEAVPVVAQPPITSGEFLELRTPDYRPGPWAGDIERDVYFSEGRKTYGLDGDRAGKPH